MVLVLGGCGEPPRSDGAGTTASTQAPTATTAVVSAAAPEPSASVVVPASASAAIEPAAAVEAFAGLYDLVGGSKTGSPPRANWGRIVFLQRGSEVTAEYPGAGTITCRADGVKLACDWSEPKAKGKAALEKADNGALVGTWGMNESATDAGKWRFALLEAAAGSEPIVLEGVYDSSWGAFDFSTSGTAVVGKNSSGDMRCEVVGAALDCTWHLLSPIPSPHFRSADDEPNPTKVRERFVRTKTGSFEGTWGVKGWSSGGGRWWMAKRP